MADNDKFKTKVFERISEKDIAAEEPEAVAGEPAAAEESDRAATPVKKKAFPSQALAEDSHLRTGSPSARSGRRVFLCYEQVEQDPQG